MITACSSDAFFHQIDVAIVQHQIDVQVRVQIEERLKVRNDMQPAEGHGGADTQVTGQAAGGTASSVVGLVRFFDGTLGPFEKGLAGFSRCQASGRAQQQLHGKA